MCECVCVVLEGGAEVEAYWRSRSARTLALQVRHNALDSAVRKRELIPCQFYFPQTSTTTSSTSTRAACCRARPSCRPATTGCRRSVRVRCSHPATTATESEAGDKPHHHKQPQRRPILTAHSSRLTPNSKATPWPPAASQSGSCCRLLAAHAACSC